MGQNGILKTRTSVLAHFFFSHRLFLWIFVISLACPLNIANSTTLLDTLIGFQPQQKLVWHPLVNQHNYGKSPILIHILTIHWQFSIAMFVSRRVQWYIVSTSNRVVLFFSSTLFGDRFVVPDSSAGNTRKVWSLVGWTQVSHVASLIRFSHLENLHRFDKERGWQVWLWLRRVISHMTCAWHVLCLENE